MAAAAEAASSALIALSPLKESHFEKKKKKLSMIIFNALNSPVPPMIPGPSPCLSMRFSLLALVVVVVAAHVVYPEPRRPPTRSPSRCQIVSA